MLINCPKCGFSQPQDRYCASCGIDMQAFKPSKDPVLIRFFKGSGVQFLVLVLVFGGATAYFLKSKPNSFDSTSSSATAAATATTSSNFAKKRAPVLEASSESVGESIPAPAANPEVVANPPAPPPTEMLGTMSPGAMAESSSAGSAGGDAAPAADASGFAANLNAPVQVEVVWAEVREEFLNRLINESTSRTPNQDYGGYRAGVIADVSRILQTASAQIKVLLKERKTLPLAKSQQWFLGRRGATPDQDLGFDVYMELLDVEGGHRGNLALTRIWRTEELPAGDLRGPANERASFPANYEVHNGESFFMAGFLPRATSARPEAAFMTISPFEVFKSSEFLNAQSDLVVFLTFDKKSTEH